MDPLTIAAAGGTRSRLEALDMLANNIANANTAAFKADREFYGLYVSADARAAESESGRPQPTDLPEVAHHWTDYSQGTLTATGNSQDLAISGKGFFEVTTPGGPRWTRNGSFRIGTTGKLETQTGDVVNVKPSPGRDFRLDPNQPFTITNTGDVMQGGQALGTIQLKVPAGLASTSLEKVGTSYYKVDPAAVPAVASGAEIHQGYLEAANGDVAYSTVRLVSVMRQFEMLQKATNVGSDMNKRAIEDVGRIGS